MAESDIADLIQNLLDRKMGFMKISELKNSLSSEMKRRLGIKSDDSGRIMAKKIEQSTENRFFFCKKGSVIYISIPCEPSDIVMNLLSEDKAFDMKIVNRLPFTKAQFAEIVNELCEKGLVKMRLDENLKTGIFKASSMPQRKTARGEYTREKFREAFDSLDKGRIFVSIPALRRKLDWPREVFDDMVKKLRNERVIQVHTGDASLMEPGEVEDCYIDEHNFRMGLVTWNGR